MLPLFRISSLLALATAIACPTFAQKEQLPEGGKRTDAFAVDTQTPLAEVLDLEEAALNRRRVQPKLGLNDYTRILDELQDDSRYRVLGGSDFRNTTLPDKILVYLRHDVDGDPLIALRMAQEGQKRGIKGTHYIRPTTVYYGKQEPHRVVRYASMDDIYRKIQATGSDIGIHTDLLEMKIRMDIDPLVFQQEELQYWRSNGFPVVGGVSNGSSFLRNLGLNNMWMFSDFGKTGEIEYEGKRYSYGTQSVEDFGFDYEGYRNTQNKRIADLYLKTPEEFIQALKGFKPGDRIEILIHPLYWGKNREDVAAERAAAN